jgi:hypothetical protein
MKMNGKRVSIDEQFQELVQLNNYWEKRGVEMSKKIGAYEMEVFYLKAENKALRDTNDLKKTVI